MRVCAWGYETPDMVQGYPYTYMSNAQAIGLMDGVDMVANTDALRGEDAQVIYNALFADYARGAKLVNTTHGTSVEQYPTLAESVWGLERAAVGTWQKSSKDDETLEMTTCKAHTWVITGEVVKVGSVDMFTAYPIDDDATELYEDGKKVDGYAFTYNGDMANIADLKGYQVELWGMGAHDEPELKKTEDGKTVYSYDWDINAIKTVKGQTKFDYTPADEALPDVDFDDVRGFVGGTSFDGTNLVWGNKSLSEKEVKAALETKNSASYRVVDWDSDGAADFIVGDIYDYYKVDAVTSKTIRLVGMNGEKFVLDKDGETDVTINGEKYTVTAEFPEDLEEGDIIEVTKSEVAEKKVIKSTWTVEVVEAETKELTKVDTKKGAYFDDELIHDAEKHNKVQYYFGTVGAKDGEYDILNEDSADNWDLYRDANGFIIDMAESDEAWAGYIYVTGAANGVDKTGSKRQYAEISGVNDKNEMVKNATLVKDAVVEINGEDEFDKYEFTANPKGRVFHYAVNEDGEITKMVELATEKGSEDYDYTDKTDSANIDTNANGDLNYRYWLDEADVIFAVEADNDNEYVGDKVYDYMQGLTPVNDLNLGAGYEVGGEDLDAGNVIAVSVDEIPDISNDAADDTATKSAGIRYDDDVNKDEQSAVVLGVNTLRYFSHTSVEAGLLTNMTYNKKDDTYTATAYVAGRDGSEFTTIDADDVTIAGDTKLDELYEILTKGNDAKYGIYCEFEFNKDGKITALSPMLDTPNAGVDLKDGIEYNQIDEDVPETYQVMRTVVNKVTSDKALTVSGARATSEDNKVYSVENGQYVDAFDIDDSTAYYKITEEKVNMQKEQVLNAWEDGFKDGYEVEEGSLEELDSYIRNYSDKYDDEYVVADVILDGSDVVAVYYYDELVGEYGYLNGEVSVNDEYVDAGLTYEDEAEVKLDCNDQNVKTGSEEITLYSIAIVDGERVATKIKTVEGKTANFGVLNVGTYYVEATGINKKTDNNDRQYIDGMYFKVDAKDSDATVEVDEKTYSSVVVKDAPKDLSSDSFKVYVNSTLLKEGADYEFRYDEQADDADYNFLLTEKLEAGDVVKVAIDAPNYKFDDEKLETEVEAAEAVKTEVEMTGSASFADDTITLNVSSNVDAAAREMLASADVWTVLRPNGMEVAVNNIEVKSGTVVLSTGDLWKDTGYTVKLDMTVSGTHYVGEVVITTPAQ